MAARDVIRVAAMLDRDMPATRAMLMFFRCFHIQAGSFSALD
jgi:hypothetical protein